MCVTIIRFTTQKFAGVCIGSEDKFEVVIEFGTDVVKMILSVHPVYDFLG